MATYYIDPTWGGTASGTFAAPYTAYSQLPTLSPGDKALLKAGTTFTGVITPNASGTQAAPIVFGVYAADGAEVTQTLAAATIAGNGTATANFTSGTRDWVTVRCLDMVNVTAGWYGVNLGSSGTKVGCKASYCRVSNQPTMTAGFNMVYNPGTFAHTVEFCEANYNLYGLLVQGAGGSKIELIGNTFDYNAEAGIRIAPSTNGPITGIIANNYCRFNGTIAAVINKGLGISNVGNAVGLVVQGNVCSDNYTTGIFCGTFDFLLNQIYVRKNTCERNGEFGVHVSRGSGFVITDNNCNFNGANRNNKYGRGIEIYSSTPTYPVGPGLVGWNTCNGNLNYGAVANNGTEGCGVGLDDNHSSVTIIGNTCIGNEGNGISLNPNNAIGTSIVTGNLCIDNYNVPVSRITGGWPAHSRAQIALYTSEANVQVSNNTVILTAAATGGCMYGISEEPLAVSSGVSIVNNLVQGHGVALKTRTGNTRTNNAFWQCTKNVESNADTTTLSDGTGAVIATPLLSSSYRPQVGSPLLGTGTHLGYRRDLDKKQRQNPPCIGAYDAATMIPG